MPEYIERDALLEQLPNCDLDNDKRISLCGAVRDFIEIILDQL